MKMEELSMSMFISKKQMDAARAEAALQEIREISNLLFNGYGEDIHPVEQLSMIRGVLERYYK